MKKMLTMAAVLSASLLSLCACSSTDPPADPGEAPLQSWYKTDAYTLLLPQGFAAQEGEDGGVTLSLDGQVVGGVRVVPYPDAAGFLDTVGAQRGQPGQRQRTDAAAVPGGEVGLHDDGFGGRDLLGDLLLPRHPGRHPGGGDHALPLPPGGPVL